MSKQPEITWSLMHPTAPDVDYMRRVIAETANFRRVDSFEICAACHSLLGGMDGLGLYEEYPEVAKTLDREAIINNQNIIREIVSLAHASGRPVYYWHREVTVWPAFLNAVPELRDQNGEFNLLGEAFEKLLRYKLRQTFEAVSELDGIVLTLTEADFSAIHNSTPDIYPPDKVVAKIIDVFVSELTARGKRFILRSFGSIAQDYEDILAGAKLAAASGKHFEVETKITPYDFNPFLPDNHFFRNIQGLTMGAECDSLGEFLGAGYLPAENVKNIVRYVRWAQKCGVSRYAIRLDRVGNNIFDTYPLNLFAYEEAIMNENATADSILAKWADKHYPESCHDTLIELDKLGIEALTRVQYIDHQLIFHQFPPKAQLKLVKAGGIFAVFKDEVSLAGHSGIWSIITDRVTPGRRNIIAEKELALTMINDALRKLESVKGQISEAEYRRRARAWNNLQVAGKALLAFCRVIVAYFDDMEAGLGDAPNFEAAVQQMKVDLVPLLKDKSLLNFEKVEFFNGMDHESFVVVGDNLDQIYLAPLLGMCELLRDEFKAEFAARAELSKVPDLIDGVVVGGIADDWRCERFMFASHSIIDNGRPARIIANQVFPNGTLTCRMKGNGKAAKLLVDGKGNVSVSVNGGEKVLKLDGKSAVDLPAAKDYEVCLRKVDAEYPMVKLLAVIG